ncbi:hypothetical protein [Leucobacter luti]|uniref:hypothetical protein n=1 Tax=Leucobacter luti TaxID=340320 RepID=UPI001C68EB72|nr:hypothetical protein [Leucobacter luti]QYM75599.1 hypothetical protein K1X41_13410 [Leucobacter luti]
MSLSHGADLFVDDEALLVSEPELNLTPTVISHNLGSAQVRFGVGLAIGADDATGETVELTAEQRCVLWEAANEKLAPAVRDRLCESLNPWPDLVALVKERR